MSTQQGGADRFRDYVPVSERLEQFYSDHPEGRVLTTIVEHDAENGFILFRAEVYRQSDDATPAATGHAFENRSEGFVNKTSYIENCETSATGRALALLGYEIKRGIASREEMEKTERMNGHEPKDDMPKCPECQESKSVIKGKAEYGGGYVCFKKKGGCGAKWDQEKQTEGFGTEQALRDSLFAQAEKLLAGLTEVKRKDALGRLLMLSTEEMGVKVSELAENARKKSGETVRHLDGGTQTGHDFGRLLKISDIKRDATPQMIESYLESELGGSITLEQLSDEELQLAYDALVVPF